MLEIFIFLQKLVNLERKTQHAVITHANMVWKSQLFFEKVGDDVTLSSGPLTLKQK